MRDVALLIARLVMAAALLPAGIARALNVPGFALALAGGGMPSPSLAATIAVVANVFGPVALVLGLAPRITGLGLAALPVLTALVLHRFWDYAGALRAAEQAALLADLGLAAGLVFYAMSGPGAWSWQTWWSTLRGAAAPPARARTPSRAPRPRAA